jgi:hypothetical protein
MPKGSTGYAKKAKEKIYIHAKRHERKKSMLKTMKKRKK